MGFRQIFGGCTPPKYLTDGVPSNIWRLYTPKIFDGWGSVEYLGAVDPQNILQMGFRQIFGVSTTPNISRMGFRQIFGGCTPPKIFDGWGSVKYLGGLQPPNISRNHIRETFWRCRPPKYFTDGVPSNIWGLYTPKIFDGWGSFKYLGRLQPPNISRNHIREIFRGCRPPKYLTDGVRQIFGGRTPQKYLTDGVPSNIWGL